VHELSLGWSGLIVNENQHMWEEKRSLIIWLALGTMGIDLMGYALDSRYPNIL